MITIKDIRLNVRKLFLFFILLVSCLIVAESFQLPLMESLDNQLRINQMYRASTEIYNLEIDNNWTETCLEYDWCTGEGTADYPYIIKNLIINSSQEADNCYIINSNAHFKIENCSFEGIFNDESSVLLNITNVTKGSIVNNTFLNGRIGILLKNTNNMTIQLNNLNSAAECMVIDNSTQHYILDNVISRSGIGIFLNNTKDITLNYNELSLNGVGISFFNSTNGTCKDNKCYTGFRGIELIAGSNYNDIIDNVCNFNQFYGLVLERSKYNTIDRNEFSENSVSGSIFKSLSDYNLFSHNNCSYNNDAGLELINSSQNNIQENICNNNEDDGIIIKHCSDYNSIISNDCSHNHRFGIVIDQSGFNYIKSNILLGNDAGCFEKLGYNNEYFLNICGVTLKIILIPSVSLIFGVIFIVFLNRRYGFINKIRSEAKNI
ncbi:MAG: hypothetical protein GF364_00945 [Candidatus Lokiarchaeota archaeon]|nr:hypothetical protein [Candidatus Lokiarchaeota archaeon]